jgi:hypothetical protein
MRKILITVSILIGLGVVAFMSMFVLVRYHTDVLPHKQLMSGAKVGWSQTQVIEHLGEPKDIARSEEEVLRSFQSWGLKPLPTCSVENKVLIYDRWSWRLFVYVDDSGRVTHVLARQT